MGKKCYLCGQNAVSKEHTPARCFFPSDSEYTKNLITVPSCKEHNEDTSKDDEYVRNIVAMSLGTNSIAFNHFINKTIESFKNSPGLLKITTGVRKHITVNGRPSYAFQIDRLRVNKVIRKISYALYFHSYQQLWNCELIVMIKNLYEENLRMDEYGELISKYETLLPFSDYNGTNPQVFKYSFVDSGESDPDGKVLRMIFYEGFHVWVGPVIASTTPKID